MSDSNTRKEKRTPVTLKIKFKSATLDQFIERYSVDVSHGGIFIRTKDPLEVGTRLRFEFQLQDASPLISGEGTVVWTREHDPTRVGVAPGMGVRFDKLGPESQAVLDKILAQKSKETPDPKFSGSSGDEKEKPKGAQPLVQGLGGSAAKASAPSASPAAPPPPTLPATPVAAPKKTMMGIGLMPPRAGFPEESSKDATPLPKPMPFHGGTEDDFSEDVFEQPTRVASLEQLIQQSEGSAEALFEDPAANRDEAATRAEKASAEDKARAQAEVEKEAKARREAEIHAEAEAKAKETARAESEAKAKKEAEAQTAAEAEAKVRAQAETREADAKKTEKPGPKKQEKAETPAQAVRPGTAEDQKAESPATAGGERDVRTEIVTAVAPPKAARSSASMILVGVIVLVAGAGGYFVMGLQKEGEVATAQSALPSPAPVVAPPSLPFPVPAAAPDAAVAPGLSLPITSRPAGALVLVDGVAAPSPTPTTLTGLDSKKSYQVVARRACFKDASVTMTPRPGLPLEMELEALPRVLHVVSSPPGAIVMADGRKAGVAPCDVPLAGRLDPTAPHTVVLTKTGYETSAEIVVSPDSECTSDGKVGVIAVTVELLPIPETPKVAPPVVERPVGPKSKESRPEPAPSAKGVTREPPTPAPVVAAPKPAPVVAPPEPPKVPPVVTSVKEVPKEAVKKPKEVPKDEHTPDWAIEP